MPISETGAALIGAGISAASTAGSTIAGGKMNKRSAKIAREQMKQNYQMFQEQNAYNQKMAEDNRRFMEDYYQKYDSPGAMMRQYAEAGLNPYAYTGDTGSMSQGMGNVPSSDASGVMSSNSNAASQMIGANSQQAQTISNAFSNAQGVVGILQQIEQLKSQQIENKVKESDYLTGSSPVLESMLPEGLRQVFGNSQNINYLQLSAMSRFAHDYADLVSQDSNLASHYDPINRLAYLYRDYISGNKRYVNRSFLDDDDAREYKFASDTLWNGLQQMFRNRDLTNHALQRDNQLRDLGINPNGSTGLDSILRFAFGSPNSSTGGVAALQKSMSDWLSRLSQSVADIMDFVGQKSHK